MHAKGFETIAEIAQRFELHDEQVQAAVDFERILAA